MIETPDPDKIFNDIVSGLELEAPEFDFSGMNNRQLVERFIEIRNLVMKGGSLLMPKTDEQRDLLAERGAIMLEMKSRGIWKQK